MTLWSEQWCALRWLVNLNSGLRPKLSRLVSISLWSRRKTNPKSQVTPTLRCFLVFSWTLLRYVRLMTRAVRPSVCPSVCRLSVILLHARQRLELYCSIFAPLNTSGTWKYSGVWKICIFLPISRFVMKTVQDTAVVTMEDEYELVYRCYFQ